MFNLVKTFQAMEQEQGNQQPHLIAIADRAIEIAKAFENQQLSTQQTLEQLEDLIRRYREGESSPERKELEGAYVVYWLLNEQGNEKAIDVARASKAAFEERPHWHHSEEQERQVRIELYKAMWKADVYDMFTFADKLLDVLRRARE
ncbi:MAG: hypothetical protein R3A46_11360 [Thermomicrobiales bacterium]